MDINKIINTASGKEPPDLVLKNTKTLNVFTGEIIECDIAISDGIIVGVGEYSGQKEEDLTGRYVVPGFINSHVHVESSMVTPLVYSIEELKWGTTTIITDPHEIVNVGGTMSIENMIDIAKSCPINYYIMLPSCVPSTPFEHSGAVLNADDLVKFKDEDTVLGLGEMMNSVGVLNCDDDIIRKLTAFSDKIIDGHSPMMRGKSLNGYICSGIKTDHESVSYDEALEKLRCGMSILVREGSASKNLDAIISGVVKNSIDTTNLAFCTDDKHLADIKKEGTIRYNIKRSVELGLSPINAIQMATINAAKIYGLKNTGAIACGYKADIVVLDNLKDFNVIEVLKDGVPISEINFDINIKNVKYNPLMLNSVHIAPLPDNAFYIPKKDKYNVIGIVENQIITKNLQMTCKELEQGILNGSIRKISVIERHHSTGNIASAYISGYGLLHGAIGTTVAHDSHNIIVIGDNDEDMKAAVNELVRVHGGYTIIRDKRVVDTLPLEFAGLMSLKGSDEFIPLLDKIIETAYSLGINRNIDPFTTLSFMALPVIPEIRITDQGLFDVDKFSFI